MFDCMCDPVLRRPQSLALLGNCIRDGVGVCATTEESSTPEGLKAPPDMRGSQCESLTLYALTSVPSALMAVEPLAHGISRPRRTRRAVKTSGYYTPASCSVLSYPCKACADRRP